MTLCFVELKIKLGARKGADQMGDCSIGSQGLILYETTGGPGMMYSSISE